MFYFMYSIPLIVQILLSITKLIEVDLDWFILYHFILLPEYLIIVNYYFNKGDRNKYFFGVVYSVLIILLRVVIMMIFGTSDTPMGLYLLLSIVPIIIIVVLMRIVHKYFRKGK